MRRLALGLLAVLFFAVPSVSSAEALRDRFNAGGYFRIMTRPDFQGGSSRLGYWNLYGRLLNEGPWGALELSLDVLQNQPGSDDVWANIHAKIEGGSFANTDIGRGALNNFNITQLYVKAGNILFDRVTWQLGTLDTYYGDLGLYDLKPAQIFFETVGLSGTYANEKLDWTFGVGDSGYYLRGPQYSTIFTGGTMVRYRVVPGQLEVGLGGQLLVEPAVPGNQFSPYAMPFGVNYADFARGEVVQQFLYSNPDANGVLPRAIPRGSVSFKAVGYVGFGNLGPIRWDNFYANIQRKHPDNWVTENYSGRQYQIFSHDLTDERYEAMAGNEMQIAIVPGKLDAVWGVLGGYALNPDNTVKPGDDNRFYGSTVLRLQYYLFKRVHLLMENSLAKEHSMLGNLYRQHVDSIFQNSAGIPDTRGFDWGDSADRNTWQFKTGVVLNPTGFGIFSRPSLRLLYGLQYSSQQAAFGSGFQDSLDQYNQFAGPERHWHSVISIEAETWF